VIEVNSGDVITVFNLNRPVRVKLLGIDAPEMGQAFGDVARKHLSDLVFDKPVVVEYSGIGADSSLTGRVLLNSTDIGAQMIRDGAAWFDPHNVSRLSVADRDVYQQSEQAARSERRGLWQAENPTAPWEFVKAKALRSNAAASLNAIMPVTKARRVGPPPELTNLTLMKDASSRVSSDIDYGDNSWSLSATRKNWRQLRPAGESFVVLVPEEGKELTTSAAFGDQMSEVKSYMARDGWAIYSVAWVTAPSYGETDRDALEGSLQGYLNGAAKGYKAGTGLNEFNCEPRGQKNISLNGFTGIEYDLTSCTAPGRVRMYTRVVNDRRQMYFASVLYREEDENVSRFLKSFTVGKRN
jgi:endonuclease YncB( thermonuclease family)